MNEPVRPIAEGIARKTTTRRSFFGRGMDLVFGALAGAAAGTALNRGGIEAGAGTACSFPGPACSCQGCLSNGVCAKPCVINTTWYAAGCWVSLGTVTCCDCTCNGFGGVNVCGCGTDYHNDPINCPNGTADS